MALPALCMIAFVAALASVYVAHRCTVALDSLTATLQGLIGRKTRRIARMITLRQYNMVVHPPPVLPAQHLTRRAGTARCLHLPGRRAGRERVPPRRSSMPPHLLLALCSFHSGAAWWGDENARRAGRAFRHLDIILRTGWCWASKDARPVVKKPRDRRWRGTAWACSRTTIFRRGKQAFYIHSYRGSASAGDGNMGSALRLVPRSLLPLFGPRIAGRRTPHAPARTPAAARCLVTRRG